MSMRLPISVGMVPVSSFWPRPRNFSAVRLPISVGMAPDNKEPRRSSRVSCVRLPISVGMLPVRFALTTQQFSDRMVRYVRLVRFPSCVGSVPESPLSVRLNTVTFPPLQVIPRHVHGSESVIQLVLSSQLSPFAAT